MLVREDQESYGERIVAEAVRTERILAMATPQAAEDFELLQQSPGGFTLGNQPELLHYAAHLLREQDRIEDVHRERGLAKRELIWCALYPHLKAAGYTLPLRYAPFETRLQAQKKATRERHDRPLTLIHMNIVPALCKKTGKYVVLKITCSRSDAPYSQELEILRLLNEEPIRNYPDNPTVRLLDVVDFPYIASQPRASSMHIIVMPMLQGLCTLDCAINGFALHLMRQTFRAVASFYGHLPSRHWMWQPHVTRGDNGAYQLQLIDFGCSQRFDLHGGPISVKWHAGQIPPPEVEADPETFYDPFSAEIYSLSETWKDLLYDEHNRDIVDLLDRMTSIDPAERPQAADCVRDLENAIARVGIWKQCEPTGALKLRASMSLFYYHDLWGFAKCLWNYPRAVFSYVFCRGWNYLP